MRGGAGFKTSKDKFRDMRCIRREVSTTSNDWEKIVLYSTNHHKPSQTINLEVTRQDCTRFNNTQPSKPIAARCRFVGSCNGSHVPGDDRLVRRSLAFLICRVSISNWGHIVLINRLEFFDLFDSYAIFLCRWKRHNRNKERVSTGPFS